MSEELLPCPFCGSIDVYSLRDNDKDEHIGYVTCNKCDANGPIRPEYPAKEEDIISAWNTRTEPTKGD